MSLKVDEKLGITSDFTIGYYDESKFKGEMRWHPVLIKQHYGIALDDIKVDNKSLGMCQKKPCYITIDSGSTYGSMPGYAIKRMAEVNLPTQVKEVPCDTMYASFP